MYVELQYTNASDCLDEDSVYFSNMISVAISLLHSLPNAHTALLRV